jgi:hypothetical protein
MMAFGSRAKYKIWLDVAETPQSDWVRTKGRKEKSASLIGLAIND